MMKELRSQLTNSFFLITRKDNYSCSQNQLTELAFVSVMQCQNDYLQINCSKGGNEICWKSKILEIELIQKNLSRNTQKIEEELFAKILSNTIKVCKNGTQFFQSMNFIEKLTEVVRPNIRAILFVIFKENCLKYSERPEEFGTCVRLLQIIIENSDEELADNLTHNYWSWIVTNLNCLQTIPEILILEKSVFHVFNLFKQFIFVTNLERRIIAKITQEIIFSLKKNIVLDLEVELSFEFIGFILQAELIQDTTLINDHIFIDLVVKRYILNPSKINFAILGVQFLIGLGHNSETDFISLIRTNSRNIIKSLKTFLNSESLYLVKETVILLTLILTFDCVKVSQFLEIENLPEEVLFILAHSLQDNLINCCLHFLSRYIYSACPAFSHLIKNPRVIFDVCFKKLIEGRFSNDLPHRLIIEVIEALFWRGEKESENKQFKVNQLLAEFIENGFYEKIVTFSLKTTEFCAQKIENLLKFFFGNCRN